MSDKTSIEWTDATWNPIVGCSIVSAGCANCYAMKQAARIEAMFDATHRKAGGGELFMPSPYAGTTKDSKAGAVWTDRVAIVDDHALTKPLRWKLPRKIFVNSMGDLFHESIPDTWIDRVFAVMALASQHTFQVLTKRSARMLQYMGGERPGEVLWNCHKFGVDATDCDGPWGSISLNRAEHAWTIKWPLANVSLGVSVERQQEANERRPDLAVVAALGWKTFVSYEPSLGPVDWTDWKFLCWLISGGESGPDARPSHPAWHRAARDFCAAHGIAYFFKQWGEWGYMPERAHFKDAYVNEWTRLDSKLNGVRPALMFKIGKRRAGRLLDGVEHDGFPA